MQFLIIRKCVLFDFSLDPSQSILRPPLGLAGGKTLGLSDGRTEDSSEGTTESSSDGKTLGSSDGNTLGSRLDASK